LFAGAHKKLHQLRQRLLEAPQPTLRSVRNYKAGELQDYQLGINRQCGSGCYDPKTERRVEGREEERRGEKAEKRREEERKQRRSNGSEGSQRRSAPLQQSYPKKGLETTYLHRGREL
jgi:hypothetical protein